MKFTLIILAVILFTACGSGTGETAASDSTNATKDLENMGGTGVDSAENVSGKNLIAANDCFTCHEMDKQNIGPSYKQIADKYDYNQGNIENLADKIIKGGKGLWGEKAMNPHPNLPEPQAQEMARYILSLNTADTLK